MKQATFLIGAFASVAAAQVGNTTFDDDFPTCGQTCIENMYAGGDPKIESCDAEDLRCLCQEPNFSYGVRDCTYSLCGESAEELAPQVFEKAIEICNEVNVDISEPINRPPDGSEDDGSTGGGDDSDDSDDGADGAVAVTSVVVTTSVDGDNTEVVSLTTTFNGVPTATTEVVSTDEEGNETTATETLYSSVAADATETSDATATGDDDSEETGGSGDDSGDDSGDGGDEDTAGETTSDNFGPAITAAPGLAAAAGLVALLL